MATPTPGTDGVRRGRFLIAAAIILGFVLLASRVATDLWVDILWFSSEGYLSVLTRDLVWVWGVRIGVGALVALLFALNLRPIAASLGSLQIRRRFGNLEISEKLPERLIAAGVVVFSLLLGLWFDTAQSLIGDPFGGR